MAGGSGERFWPMSRHATPKHMLPIVGRGAMITQTVERLKGLIPPERVLILTQKYQIKRLRELCPQLPKKNFFAEPMRRDTAAAAALAGLLIEKRDPNATFVVLPSDAYIKDAAAYRKTLKIALEAASKNDLIVTVGMKPTRPATNYGYLKTGKPTKGLNGVLNVERFVEKPDLSTAKKYLKQGGYYWNGGVFAWSVPTLKAAFKKHCPALSKPFSRLAQAKNFEAELQKVFPKLDRISVDYAVMEKADNIAMVPATFDWDDVGEWTSTARHHAKDENGNTLCAQAVLEASKNNIVYSGNKKHLIALCGVKNLIVVHTPDATLVCDKAHAGHLKELLKKVPETYR